MPARKRVDLSELDFRPIPGEEDYDVFPLQDEGKFRRQGAVGPYSMDAAQFKVADIYDDVQIGSLGRKDTSYYIRVGLNSALPPIWKNLLPILELYRRIEELLKARGFVLVEDYQGGKSQGNEFFWRSTYRWAVDSSMGAAEGGASVTTDLITGDIDVSAILKQSAMEAVPGLGLISGILKGLRSRRQQKASGHITKWLGWMNLAEFEDIIPKVAAAAVTAGVKIPVEGESVLDSYSQVWGNWAMAKWVRYGQGWEATPDVYMIDRLKERLKAALAPLKKIADQRSAALEAAKKIAEENAKLDTPSAVDAIGALVGNFEKEGVISEGEVEMAIRVVHKVAIEEPLINEEEVMFNRLKPHLEKSGGISLKSVLPLVAAAAYLF